MLAGAEGGDGEGAPKVTLQSLGLPSSVEGSELHVDDFGEYQRLYVNCPLSLTHHRGATPCRKYRGLGASQCRMLGPMEPVSYLGAWLQQGCSMATRRGHINYRPPQSAVRAFAVSQGWV